jgi:hypothetical protein
VKPESAEPAAGLADLGLAASPDYSDRYPLDISVVMPCLNEEGSVGICVRKAWAGIRASGMRGEVIVADNGSADGSVAAAKAAGAHVVHEPHRGYGSAYLRGFSAARGRIIVMGDCDDSYDFTDIPELIRPLADGYDYVLGSRFAGQIRPQAMSWSHRRIGNPALTAILNALFRLKVSDAHSGFRALTRIALDTMALQSEGMELASEIVVKAARANLRTAEIPITYHPRIGESKLNSLRDGWRHLRFLLLLSPDYLFVFPGVILTALGILGQLPLLALAGSPRVLLGKVMLGLLTVVGSQALTLGLFAKTYARRIGLETSARLSGWAERNFTLERGLAAATGLGAGGLVALITQLGAGFAALASGGIATSVLILGLVGIVLGCTLWFDAFFLSMVLLRRPAPAGAQTAEPVSPGPDDELVAAPVMTSYGGEAAAG